MTIVRPFRRLRNEYNYLRNADRHARILRFTRAYLPMLRFILVLPLLLGLAVLLRIGLKILKPFVHIRFGRIWSFQLGNYALPTELYLCEKEAGIQPRHTIDVWYHHNYEHYNRALVHPVKPEDLVANKQMDIMFRRCLRVSDLARSLDKLNRLLPGGIKEFTVKGSDVVDHYGLFDRFPAHLTFTEEEEERGQAGLAQMGIEPGNQFVCFHARDGVWLRRALQRDVSVYGEWGLFEEKNSSINNYLLAAENFTALGYYAIRMGKFVGEPINPPNCRVIDYATKFHSDFMDVYLSAKCTLFIGQVSGMTCLPMIFRSPMGFVNVYPLGWGIQACVYRPSIFIPKMLYSAPLGRLLSFRETMEFGVANLNLHQPHDLELFQKLGLQNVENTPEEIAEVGIEMHQRLQSTFELSEEDEELQARFLSVLRSYPNTPEFKPGMDEYIRIGAHFLRTHQEWLV